MLNTKFISGKEASKILGVHQRTLYLWEKKKYIDVIRSPGGKRFYNINKYLKKYKNNHYLIKNKASNFINNKNNKKLNICYIRVSSKSQINDLMRQKNVMIKNFPKYKLIEDIGSGLNLNKRGIRKIIDYAIGGRINKLIIAHKDRLIRFGYDLIEDLIKKYSNGKIIILDKNTKKRKPEEELAFDVLQLMNVYVTKMNGLRRYKNKINNKK